ncbi:transcriptional regulator [Spirochaetia bacterium]|nr:transcriptional regulator [Spirochaetia bacterium]
MYLERLVIDNIKRIRKEKGISQEKLAEACNTATSYIGLMEIYRNVPKLSTIERIAAALEIDPLALFQDANRTSAETESDLQCKKQKILAAIDKEIDKILHEI